MIFTRDCQQWITEVGFYWFRGENVEIACLDWLVVWYIQSSWRAFATLGALFHRFHSGVQIAAAVGSSVLALFLFITFWSLKSKQKDACNQAR